MIGEAAGSENVGQRLPGGGPTGVRERIAAWGRGARLAAVIVLALAVISLSLLVVIPLGSGSDELAVDVSLAGVDDLVVGEPGEVEVTVEVTQLRSESCGPRHGRAPRVRPGRARGQPPRARGLLVR